MKKLYRGLDLGVNCQHFVDDQVNDVEVEKELVHSLRHAPSSMERSSSSSSSSGGTGRRKGKVRFAPKEYFLPRRPLHVSIAVNGACVLAGLGVGMLIENWIGAKVAEDGGYVTLGTKKEETSEAGVAASPAAASPLQQ